jgi:quinoprotein glucose dehydrogenase
MKWTVRLAVITSLVSAAMMAAAAGGPQNVDWPVYGGQKAGDRYSGLTQINRKNVRRLKVAWTYDTGEKGGLQTSPLIVGQTMFVYTPTQKVVALDAATGKELWRFDSGLRSTQADRGFSFWMSGEEKILFADVSYNIWALDPDTGKPIASFGDGGKIDLREGLGTESPVGQVTVTTPGVVYKDLLITGFRTAEAKPAAHGDIRAYDVHTGALRWAFHTIPHPGEQGYETWPAQAWKYTGAANNWAGMVVDEQRGIVYVPTGSAASDFYGADRAGNDLYANTLLALDANTGKRLWHFQGVHHDMWDRDFPSPPALVTVKHDGQAVDAVAQTTKHGVLYLFDRVTGKPLFPVEERNFPASDTPGEWTSPTQPMPTTQEPYARQRLTEEMLTTRTPEAHAWAVEQFKTFRSDGQFVPLSRDRQTVVFPGFDGGAEWGGPAVDVTTGVIYINSNDIAWTGGLEEQQGEGKDASFDRYRFTGYAKFLDPDGYPAIVPPWGTLNAIDLNTGKYLWKVPLGEYPELAAKGMKNTGSENYGGPVVTAGGLVILGATIYDHKMRAFDSKTGKLLWEYVMPAAGNATPAMYMVDGKQYLAIATSNVREKKPLQNGVYVVFALP